MISYFAYVCIFEWPTSLPKEVFIFVARKIHFSFSECRNSGVTSCSNLANCKHHKKTTNGSIHYYTSLVSYIAYDRFLGRNHGASSLLNGIVGSVFTVNGGIS